MKTIIIFNILKQKQKEKSKIEYINKRERLVLHFHSYL